MWEGWVCGVGLWKTRLWALFSRFGFHATSPGRIIYLGALSYFWYLLGFHGHYIGILPRVPGLPMVPTNTHAEEHSSPPQFCDSHHSTTPHHKNHGALQSGQKNRHKPWGGKNIFSKRKENIQLKIFCCLSSMIKRVLWGEDQMLMGWFIIKVNIWNCAFSVDTL